MRIGYADPPYIGCAHLYKDHADFAGEVDHAELIARLERDFDGWVLHTSAAAHAIAMIAPLLPPRKRRGRPVESGRQLERLRGVLAEEAERRPGLPYGRSEERRGPLDGRAELRRTRSPVPEQRLRLVPGRR